MISTAIIPRFCKIVESGGAFDPYSAKDVRRAIDFVEQVEASVEREDLKFQVQIVIHPILTSSLSIQLTT